MQRPVLPVQSQKRLPTLLLLLLVVIAFVVALQLVNYPVRGANSNAPLMLMTVIALVYLVAVGAGYRPKRRWLVVGMVYCAGWHIDIVPPVAHPEAVPALLALPGLVAWLAIATLTGVIVVLLRPARIGAVGRRSHSVQ
ncbi:MAG: hypothetical protein LC777_20740, partial [Actinobacteria bacterium]|nr:hypothetical protein [Actinomycetota bacterium]